MSGSEASQARIEGDYDLPPGGSLRAPPGAAGIEITGAVRSNGSGTVEGSLGCRELRVEDGTLTVRGSVRVSGHISLRRARLDVVGDLKAGSLSGDKAVVVGGNMECPDVDVGGHVDVSGSTVSERFEVGGSAELRGTVTLSTLDVGGRVTVGGGTVRRSIEVGGRFESTAPLTFGSLEIGGMGRLRASAQGESLEVGGMIDCDGDLVASRTTEVGGRIRVAGKFQSPRIEVGGFLSAGSVEGGDIEVGGVTEVTGVVTARRLEVGGRFTAERAIVQERIEVGDEIRTSAGVKTDILRVGERSTIRGPVVAREVTVGSRASVEDIWAVRLRMETRSHARNVHAEEIEAESRVEITGETLYVRSLHAEGARLSKSPRQVATLPPAPL
jgi:cytoskeletal protein CcmA (bactofilin family)